VGSVKGWVSYDDGVIVEGEGAVLGLNLGRSIVTNGEFVTRLFPNYFGQYLFNKISIGRVTVTTPS